MALSLDHISKTVGNEIHLKDINLKFETGSRYVVLGRTLAGKTSLLRILAGLDRPTKGKLLSGDKDISGLSVRRRSVAMVYQQFINYPSLNIFNNIASPLKIAGMDKNIIEQKVRRAAEILHIEHLLDRLPAELSGGQQQRTAIARALVKESELLLLDEPLVNLDYKLREELRVELRGIFEKRSAVVVYTTTEPTEALMLGGNIIVMDEGRILQTGPTAHVYHHPASVKVAEVFSDPPVNFIPGRVKGREAELGPDIRFPLSGHLSGLEQTDYTFGVRSNHLFLKQQSGEDAAFHARVELSEINGSETFTHINYNGNALVVQDVGIFSRKIGTEISVYVRPDRFFVFDKDGKLVAAPDASEI
ncbi:MAG: ABC transporter ATP-binding protein [Desulfococcaceae bacterium]|jgi:glycerol transport system ATP-binding protein|nr:ABC transporter ATP-binding protein [Desulfococcaceae bacterium]